MRHGFFLIVLLVLISGVAGFAFGVRVESAKRTTLSLTPRKDGCGVVQRIVLSDEIIRASFGANYRKLDSQKDVALVVHQEFTTVMPQNRVIECTCLSVVNLGDDRGAAPEVRQLASALFAVAQMEEYQHYRDVAVRMGQTMFPIDVVLAPAEAAGAGGR